MRARIWIRPVLVFWGSILLYRREKSWLPVKVLHLNSQLPPAVPFTTLWLEKTNPPLTAIQLGTRGRGRQLLWDSSNACLPFCLNIEGEDLEGTEELDLSSHPGFTAWRERQRNAHSQYRRNLGDSYQNNHHMALPKHVKANLQGLILCPLIFVSQLRQPKILFLIAISLYFATCLYLHADFAQTSFLCGDTDVIIQVLLRTPTREQNRPPGHSLHKLYRTFDGTKQLYKSNFIVTPRTKGIIKDG